MKYFFLVSLLLLTFACKKENEREKNEYFNMKINGELWESVESSSITSGYVPSKPNIFFYLKDTILVISAWNKEKHETIDFSSKLNNIGTYKIKLDYKEIRDTVIDNDTNLCLYRTKFYNFENGFDCFGVNYFSLKDSIKTQLLITEFDTISKKIIGSFFMTLVNSNNDKLIIEEGSFNTTFNIQTK